MLDAVATLTEKCIPTLQGWAGEFPKAVADPKAFKDWAGQFPALHVTATALGIDTTTIVGGLTGSVPPTRSRSRSRTGSRRSAPAAGNGRSTQPVTGEQILAYLADHPGLTAKQIAAGLGASYDTVQRRFTKLLAKGQVTREGERANTRWYPLATMPAGTAG